MPSPAAGPITKLASSHSIPYAGPYSSFSAVVGDQADVHCHEPVSGEKRFRGRVRKSLARTGFVSRFCSWLFAVSSAQGARGRRPHALFLAYCVAEQASLRGMDQIE